MTVSTFRQYCNYVDQAYVPMVKREFAKVPLYAKVAFALIALLYTDKFGLGRSICLTTAAFLAHSFYEFKTNQNAGPATTALNVASGVSTR